MNLLDMPEERRRRAIELAFCPGEGPADNSCSSREGSGKDPEGRGYHGSVRPDRIIDKLDKAAPLKWTTDRVSEEDQDGPAYGASIASFKTPSGRQFHVSFEEDAEYEDGEWRVHEADIAFTDDRMSTKLSGKGEAFSIFQAVGRAVSEYIDAETPMSFTFSATGKSRITLYDRMSKMLKSLFPEYKLEENMRLDGSTKYYNFEHEDS